MGTIYAMKIYFIICFLFSLHVHAGKIEVGKNKPFQTIKAAVHAAASGDTIFVDQGKYFEKNLVIDKPLVLVGINYPVLDGESIYEIISIKADYVSVDGFRLQHSGVSSIEDFAAIKIYNRHHSTIINNIIDDAFFGIYSQYAINRLIKNNVLIASHTEEQQSGNGIHCWKSDSMRIIANTITGHRDGIYFEFVTNSVIWRNNAHHNLRYGLHFMFSNNDAYIANIFENNGAGVAVMFSKGVKMYNNYFSENWCDASYGILLKEIGDAYIIGNHFEKNTTAIYAEGSSRVQMNKNIFRENGWAFRMQASCMDITLSENNFLGNTFDIATNGSLVLNNFNSNYWDKYEGYDLNHDQVGDIPFRPVSMYSMIIERNPPAMILFHSFITALLDKTEKILPSLTPETLLDQSPLMKSLPL